jgi:very-short-patch-repair endonuclease
MLQAHGYTVVRFTRRQVLHETLLVTVRIAQLPAAVRSLTHRP